MYEILKFWKTAYWGVLEKGNGKECGNCKWITGRGFTVKE